MLLGCVCPDVVGDGSSWFPFTVRRILGSMARSGALPVLEGNVHSIKNFAEKSGKVIQDFCFSSLCANEVTKSDVTLEITSTNFQL